MKDKELRKLLIKSGIIEEKIVHLIPPVIYYKETDIKQKLDAIIEYLDIKFEQTPPSKLIAKKKIMGGVA